jgi:hypothetical protein
MFKNLILTCALLWSSCANAQMNSFFPGPGTAHSTGASLPLDGVSNVKVAFSTRKLRTAYAGAALQVTNMTTTGTQDIGFASGSLDTSALATFCSGATCQVTTWYDQSGNAADAILLFSTGPVIYTGGAVKNINGHAAVFWDPAASPSTNRLKTSLDPNPVNTLYTNSVANYTNTGSENPLAAVSNCGAYAFYTDSTSHLQSDKYCSGVNRPSTGTMTYGTGGVYEGTWDLSTGNYAYWIDGAASGTGTSLQTFIGGLLLELGNNVSGASLSSGLQGEFIQIDQVGSFAGRATLQANQKAYWGTP